MTQERCNRTIFDNEELSEMVEDLIRTRREDDWWDFKECYPEDRASLLHDIICLANNRVNRDAYLIFGVRDKTYEIVGVEKDAKRKNQQNIVDFLRLPNFAGQTRPRVEVRSIYMTDGAAPPLVHEIDVLIIKNSTDVPYYLVEDYQDRKYKPDNGKPGKIVRASHIYTRVMDNNTPIDSNADIRDVEYLWKKRFGLLQTPLEQIKVLLQHPEEWEDEDGHYYHKLFPQYTIAIEGETDEAGVRKPGNCEFYHYLQADTEAYYGILKIFHYSTQLYSCQVTDLDGHRMTAPCPEWMFIKYRNYGDPDICLKYYAKTSLLYLLLRFLEEKIGDNNGGEAQIATRRLLDVVLLFDDEDAVMSFKAYMRYHLGMYDELYAKQRQPYIADPDECVVEIESKRICDAHTAKEMQVRWEESLAGALM